VQRLFGAPVQSFAVVVTVLLAATLGAIGVLALRNRIFFKLGVRNLTRRPGRSAVIIAGLMLATAIIATALSTGDTMASTIRSSVYRQLGATDELISVKSAGSGGALYSQAIQAPYFSGSFYQQVADVARTSDAIDGIAPAVIETVAVQDRTSQQNEPTVTLFASDPQTLAGFGDMVTTGGKRVSLADLAPGELYVNDRAAEKLDARAGDRLVVLAAGRLEQFAVREVVRYDGSGTDGAAVLLPLAPAQRLVAHAEQLNHLLVSNRGDASSGVGRTDAARAALLPMLDHLGLDMQPVKRDGLEQADAQGNAFMSMFTTFGMFTISAGVLLIFLTFVLLAAERRGEMGIARAVGTQRRHLVSMFVFEGVAYDLGAAIVGALLGVAIAFGMIEVLQAALHTQGVDLTFSLQSRSVAIAFALGVLLTLVVVAVSAWRVSMLDVSTAIRNLPDPPRHRRHRRWRLGAVGLTFGGLMTWAGAAGAKATPLLVGVSIVIVSAVPIATALGVPERAAFTAGGAALVVWLLLPFSVYEALVPDLSMDFSTWVANGLLVVIGVAWLIVYNGDVILSVTTRVFGRIKSLAPVLRTSITTPLRNRFRTGMTLAMFTLVVFTLVVGTTTTSSFTGAMNDLHQFGGGFQVRAETSPLSPVSWETVTDGVEGLPAGSVTRVGAQSFVPAEVEVVGSGTGFADYPVRGLDDSYLGATTYGMAAIARGYSTPKDVWRAVAATPGLAVVDSSVVKRRSNWGFGVPPDLQITSFLLEDKVFDPVTLEVRDPATGAAQRFTVIGVLSDTVPYSMAGISVSQRALTEFGPRAVPTVHYLQLADHVDATLAAKHLEAAFLADGMHAQAMSELLDDAVGASVTFQRIILGFMGLGLLTGVAALAVISARSVVERRQQIGVMRAIGFQRAMVQRSFLLEASFVTLVSIVSGTLLGLIVARNVVADAARSPSWGDLHLTVPWSALAVIFAAVYAAGLLTTWAPARRAARVDPAAALRYQ
jgi:putative ABC transport system permease protein